ncbi:YeeE/YedE thiosulfate transporter family protein [Anaerobaca lacustris]|uniref:YeeE/YedE thiosulfate transporter family protein n=1 Tax=Anaerobaca lacustris TaxID=3044600 RepID=A0AAW6U4C4_9BACT|nr:YeeE/YedE thiosulfate transporter family protein [Sedimentisphaerales bacterium M17dextr]
MLTGIHSRKGLQLVVGLLLGIAFGFLLQKGGVTRYDVIIGQLLFRDFTVLKIMLSAVLTGMLGVHALKSLGLARLHPKPGSIGTSVVGGLIFGVGFGVLGYCPGTVAGAVGQGSMDALLGGVVGILIGAGLFAAVYPKIQSSVLNKGHFGEITLPELFRVHPWAVVLPVVALIVVLLVLIEKAG